MRALLLTLCISAVSFASPFDLSANLITTEIPALIRGSVADRKDYPGVVWIGNCTATLVGPRTLVSAAHCTRTSASFSIGASRYSSTCVPSPYYPRNSTSDYVWCYTNREVEGVEFFENVLLDEKEVVRGDKILLSGFGCQRWGGNLDGQFRVGVATVTAIPSGSNNDVVAGQGATLCSGDSGGPAWTILPNGDRDKLLSVNSRSNTTTVSYLSALFTSQGKETLNRYLSRFPTKICGVHADAPDCRNAKPLEPVVFDVQNEVAVLNVTIQPGVKYTKEEVEKVMATALEGSK